MCYRSPLFSSWLLSITSAILLPLATMHAQEYKLVWADEFDYNGLPDKTKWVYEHGFVRNKEKQYYTVDRLENARVENGHLIIEGRKEAYTAPNGKQAEYTAASITTQDKAAWTYGRMEVRAKLPEGKGQWPAIWMLGTNIKEIGWPKCGEIDIMEFVGKEPNHIHGTVHWYGRVENKKTAQGKKIDAVEPYKDFHVYAVEWSPEKIVWYFDDQVYHTFMLDRPDLGTPEENPFTKPHYLLLNLALGGSWGGEIDDAMLPQKFVIDYVRVYQK